MIHMIEPEELIVRRYFLDVLNTPTFDWTMRILILLIGGILIGISLYISAKRK